MEKKYKVIAKAQIRKMTPWCSSTT